MLQTIFLTDFYTLIQIPNKEEVFEACENVVLSEDQDCTWNELCTLKVENLSFHPLDKLLAPSIELSLKNLNVSHLGFEMKSIWKNTYHKGYFQEMHDHCDGGENSPHLSAVIFLEDHVPNSAQFYFFNTNQVAKNFGIVLEWDMLCKTHYYLSPKKGDMIMFPSYVFHGVSPHKIKTPRHTISFNLRRSS